MQLDIPHSYLHELDGPDHRIVLEVAGQQEPLIRLPQVLGHPLHVWYRQRLSELFLHRKDGYLRYRIVREVLLFHKPGAKGRHPSTIVVSGQRRSLAIEKNVVQEIGGQRCVQLVHLFIIIMAVFQPFLEDIKAGIVVYPRFLGHGSLLLQLLNIGLVSAYDCHQRRGRSADRRSREGSDALHKVVIDIG